MAETPQARLQRQAYPGPDWRTYRLTAHFKLGELVRDQEHAPPPATMQMCRVFCVTVLEPLRRRFGACTVISGHRTPARNAQVGGAARSWHVWEWHPRELGVDVVFARGNPATWARAARDGHAGGIGTYSAHLHLDSRSDRVEWSSAAP